ncbi:DUF72 domain-containing protein [Gracilimonas mengyeensis]|uniref:Uncharacterized conserved protein YecE, DUF72 family n=1 Tax=Gracilimonas mengyeensis TaxID=1302730 RepID=A0A521F1X8_9BACT|nr:DUF72 domain-containing protein [Gracilimonas mengyeensis]SMO90202.1 Uncharacterized conserved protein YecE, DUF72 family [Gracilimonas mengyeensis]
MKFGSVDHPENVDFTLPEDHPDTLKVLGGQPAKEFDAYVGCAKWNKKDLKGFYPRGTKDELHYYSRQFNSIELNATHYKTYGPDQAETWKEKTPNDFKFFPKVVNSISHFKRLKNIEAALEEYLHGMRGFGDQLEMIFLQLRDDFKPKDFDRVQRLVEIWPEDIPLAIELRHEDWFADAAVASQLYQLFEEYKVANVITDTAGRRDLLHMRLTTPVAFIRYVGANHPSDYDRLDEWVERLKFWKARGLEKLYFFVHQNIEKESPLLSAHFIRGINKELGTDLNIPGKEEQGDLGL